MKHYRKIAVLYAATTLVATLAAYWICTLTYYNAIFGVSTVRPLPAIFYDSMAQSLAIATGAVAVILLTGLLILRRLWKLLGRALLESQTEVAALFDDCPDGLLDCDDKGLILRVNQRAFVLCGLEADELPGRPIGDVLRLASGQRLDAFGWPPVLGGSGLTGGPIQMNLLRADGTSAPVSCRAACFWRDGQEFTRLELADLSERHSLQSELQRRDESLSLLSAASFEGLAITDGELVIEGNQALCSFTGYEHSRLPGLPLEQLFALESREILRQRLAAPMEGTFELRAQRADGSHFQCLVSLKTIPFGSGRVVAAALRDITDSKAAERAIQQYQRREAELAAIQKTAATCSHEINNPLTGLLATLQMLLEDESDGGQREMLDDALVCTRRIRDVLAQLEQLTNPKYRQYTNGSQIIDLRQEEPVVAVKD